METHPVPQNISSYEFHLVGDMTLKQFVQLAGGLVIAFVFFRLPIIALIKYPLAFLSVLLGVLMAFVPVNGRPFSTWFFAFLKAIYSPTEYVWKPASSPPVIAALNPAAPAQQNETPPTEPAKTQFVPSFSSLVASKLPNIAPSAPTQTSVATIITDKKPETEAIKAPASPPKPDIPPPTPPPTAQEVLPEKPVPVQPASQPVAVPPAPASAGIRTAPQAEATSLVNAPTVPNVLTGMVNGPTGQPLGSITVEIVDTSTGIPARALRTNRLGQFQIAIPLTPGTYNVIAEKEGLSFDPVSVQVKGSIIPPIILTAKT